VQSELGAFIVFKLHHGMLVWVLALGVRCLILRDVWMLDTQVLVRLELGAWCSHCCSSLACGCCGQLGSELGMDIGSDDGCNSSGCGDGIEDGIEHAYWFRCWFGASLSGFERHNMDEGSEMAASWHAGGSGGGLG
jgi:hypothetical protein